MPFFPLWFESILLCLHLPGLLCSRQPLVVLLKLKSLQLCHKFGRFSALVSFDPFLCLDQRRYSQVQNTDAADTNNSWLHMMSYTSSPASLQRNKAGFYDLCEETLWSIWTVSKPEDIHGLVLITSHAVICWLGDWFLCLLATEWVLILNLMFAFAPDPEIAAVQAADCVGVPYIHLLPVHRWSKGQGGGESHASRVESFSDFCFWVWIFALLNLFKNRFKNDMKNPSSLSFLGGISLDALGKITHGHINVFILFWAPIIPKSHKDAQQML